MLNLADLLRVPQVDTGLPFDISPDGGKVAFSWNRSGNWEIYELPIGGSAAGQPISINTKLRGAKFSPQYSSDGRYVAFALDPDGSEAYHIVLHELETDSSVDLTPDSPCAQQPNFVFSRDGKILAILSDELGQFALYLLTIDSAEKRLLLDLHRPIWDVRWSPDGKWIAVEAEMQASDRGLFVIQVESGSWRQVTKNRRGLNARHPAWSPDSKSLAFSAQSEEWFDIGVYELERDQVRWLTQSEGDCSSPCWSRDGRRLGWVHAQGAGTRLEVLDGSGILKRFELSAGVHHMPRFTPNGEILFLFESPQKPPDLWKLQPEGAFEQLTNSMPAALQDAAFVLPEEISYTGDPLEVPALLYRGNGEHAVISIHGGPNWHVQFLWDPLMAHMASRGWTVLAPNYRGSTGYGRAWQIASRFRMGSVDTRDCAAGAAYLVRERLADPRKVAVTGRSHGGYLTMTCLTQFPDRWCGGSAVVPFLNWFKSHADSREDLQHWNLENMGDPEENYKRWYDASPYFFLDRVSTPVQLICGGNDPRCPASDSLEARDKLVELGKDVEMLLYEDEGHSFLRIENVIDSETRRVEFLAKALE